MSAQESLALAPHALPLEIEMQCSITHKLCVQIATKFGINTPGDHGNSSTAWTNLRHLLQQLNHAGGGNIKYKLLFLGRHGEGFHNVAEQRYGTLAWETKWAALDGDEHSRWVDSLLTANGEEQARRVGRCWAELREEGVVLPTSFYSSPLRRCLQTAERTFGELGLSDFKVVVKEGLREVMGVHTCDRRSSKEAIEKFFDGWFRDGGFKFEEGFAEKDLLWRQDHRETDEEIDERMRYPLDNIFERDASDVISVTSHSGATASILRIVGHRPFPLQTGGMIPVLVRAVRTPDSSDK